jgi:RHS repeat-associated protein
METNETGQVISYEEYHPFGTSAYRVAKSGTDLSLKRYRFTNKERDDETGLYYFGVRYYAAWLGRWTSSDPGDFVDGLNMYVYVRNNPVNGVDELGYSTENVEKPKQTYNNVVEDTDIENSSRVNHNNVEDTDVDENKKKPTIYFFDNKTGKFIGVEEGTSKKVIGRVIKIGEDIEEVVEEFIFNDIDVDKTMITEDSSFRLDRDFQDEVDSRIEATVIDTKENWEYQKTIPNRSLFNAKQRAIMDSSAIGGKLDFVGDTSIKKSENILRKKNRLFVIDGVAYNGKDAGNFLWGASLSKLKVPLLLAQIGAHYNNHKSGNAQNPEGDDYEPQKGLIRLDSPADQRAIKKGHKYARKNKG